MRRSSLLFAAVLAIFTASLLTAQGANATGLSGRRAPSFSLPDSAFLQHDVLDYRGKWLLLDFMRTDCPHCKALSQLLEKKRASWGTRVAVLSVVISPPDNQATVAKYIAETKITNPMVFDSGQVALSYFKATPARPAFDTPHLFAINPQGMIVRDWAQLQAEDPGFSAELDAVISGASKKKK
ncbi:MAG: TlpA disulfide reductase family protein [Bryobacteraceae bacterium]